MPSKPEELIEAATAHARKLESDVYLYNGPISRGFDMQCFDAVANHVGRKSCILILVTSGGDPDAGYKISRYFQDRYERFTVLVSGICKSAGTLIALGAHELAFMPFGELGPLDIQLGSVDKLDAPQSGLAIQEALDTLEMRAKETYAELISGFMQDNGGLLSFHSASEAAADFVTSLYSPVFARIDPEEVGGRSRSMRIAHEYGKRLAMRSQNLKPETLSTLAEKYPSHSFAIDQREAQQLFKNVRMASQAEKDLVLSLGTLARFPSRFVFRPLSDRVPTRKESRDDKPDARTRAARNGAGAPGDEGASQPVAKRPSPAPGKPARIRGNGRARA